MLTKHIQDLSTLHPDFTLDLDSLAYAMYLRDSQVRLRTQAVRATLGWVC